MIPNKAGKYSCYEFERKYLLNAFPSDLKDSKDYCLLEDRYFDQSNLRLRIVSSSTGKILTRKLTQKFIPENSSAAKTVITTIYLQDQDWKLFDQLPASSLFKRRYKWCVGPHCFSLDQFQGPLAGLVLAEIEFNSEEEMNQFTLPYPDWLEVTLEPKYLGARLAQEAEIPGSAKGDAIQIIPYQADWSQKFLIVQKKLMAGLQGLFLAIDHIGSTSVPGLASKDRIDVQITVQEIDEDFKLRFDQALSSIGFGPSKWSEDHRPPGDITSQENWIKLYISGVHPELKFRANIHVRAIGRENQIYPLLFKEYLIRHQDSALAYQKLKEELARFHYNNSIAYCEIKDPVCDLIMVEAKKWAKSAQWKP